MLTPTHGYSCGCYGYSESGSGCNGSIAYILLKKMQQLLEKLCLQEFIVRESHSGSEIVESCDWNLPLVVAQLDQRLAHRNVTVDHHKPTIS